MDKIDDHCYSSITLTRCHDRKQEYLKLIKLKYKKEQQSQIWSSLKDYFGICQLPHRENFDFISSLDRLFPDNKKNGFSFWGVKDTHYIPDAITIDSLDNMDRIMTENFQSIVKNF